MKVRSIQAMEILDSRGNPTVEVNLQLEDNSTARAMVPSGASTGEKEAVELRDGDLGRYGGKGVLKAVANVNEIMAKEIKGKSFATQKDLDELLILMDGTENKSNLGANAILGVSMAFARATANSLDIPLYQYLGHQDNYILPVPCMNVINGGRHADNNIDFQEFMIAPHNAPTFTEAIRMGEDVFHTLKSLLKSKNLSTGIGDEGGFAPDLKSNEQAVEIILEAIVKAGYKPGTDVSICLDPASSEMWNNGKYRFFKSSQKELSTDGMIRLWEKWIKEYPIVLLEDGLAENDWEGWKILTKEFSNQLELVGDDIFCTNAKILAEAIKAGIANSVLIKLNQIGTVTETLDCMALAKAHQYNCFVSHRSGETVDSFISDLTVGTNAGHLKTGSGCRGERIEKFNRLMRIERELGAKATFAGISAFKNK
ncbi:phosphopyruvate hydratase [Elizabethkingia meningoseptica]|uniref:phosphopyruvate hydratase n=1 Tax=Elizabethkingia meningoseptica TaxID=238 RepID=UPI0038912B64